MDVMNRIIDRLSELGLSQADLCKELGINYSVFTTWKKRGTEPPTKFLVHICEFLNITLDYLLTGKDHSTISSSNVGAIGNNSNGTVTISNNNMSGSLPRADNEVTEELNRILQELPLRERSKLITMIYDFEDEYKKRGRK